MATKTLTVTEEAYDRLAGHKREGESFSDVILRLVTSTAPTDLAGVLDPEAAEAMAEAIEETREDLEDDVSRTGEEMGS